MCRPVKLLPTAHYSSNGMTIRKKRSKHHAQNQPPYAASEELQRAMTQGKADIVKLVKEVKGQGR